MARPKLASLRRSLVVAVALATAGRASCAEGEEAAAAKVADARPAFTQGLVELKRQATARGTPDETTKTNLKLDWFPQGSAVAMLRLELPFPDAKTTFAGSPFDPDFGDAKIRVGFAAVDALGLPTTSFIEVTFPTADPESQGTGKYQFSAGAKAAFGQSTGPLWSGAAKRAWSLQLQQVVSFAGDASRTDINQTKLELEWRDTWSGGHFVKATFKPVVDWVGDKRTGAVLEVEGGWVVDPRWSVALMAGGRLWGNGVPSTYSERVELKLVYRY